MAKKQLAYKEEPEDSDQNGFTVIYGYPENFEILPISEQIIAFQRIPEFSHLDFAKIENLAKALNAPKQAEGLAVVPKFTVFSGLYFEALIKMIQVLKNQRADFYDFGSSSLSYDSLALEQKFFDFLIKQTEETKGDFLIFPVQLGKDLQNKTTAQAARVLDEGELFMDAFTSAAILITHPNFLASFPCLGLECASTRVDMRKAPNNLFPQVEGMEIKTDFNCNLSFAINEQNRLMFGLKWSLVFSPALGLATIFTGR